MIRTSLALICLAAAPLAPAAVVERTVTYKVGDAEMTSTLVYDDAGAANRPGVLMVPNWMGKTPTAIARAKELAGDDYVFFVADVYGSGVLPADTKAAGEMVGKLRGDPALLRARMAAALEQFRAQAGKAPFDVSRIGAIGFCFGGSAALELARSGADVDAVVTFHAGLGTSQPAKAGDFAPSVLVLNGAEDGNVAADEIAGFQDEMRAAKADWQFVNLGGAVHCFSEAEANRPPGCVYHEPSAQRAYALMHDHFAERFGK